MSDLHVTPVLLSDRCYMWDGYMSWTFDQQVFRGYSNVRVEGTPQGARSARHRPRAPPSAICQKERGQPAGDREESLLPPQRPSSCCCSGFASSPRMSICRSSGWRG
eukprot:2253802-Prymnesium_polylepis.1